MEINKDIRLMVVGVGKVGINITQSFAQQGFNLVGVDINEELIKQGRAQVEKDLEKLVSKEKISAEEKDAVLNRIQLTTDFDKLQDADVVIEAVFEDMGVKKELFQRLDNTVKSDEALLLTNTSSLSVSEIGAATQRPDRVAGMHFFNPVTIMKLVEVVRAAETSDDTIEKIVELAKLGGKVPLVCKDSPGFVVNRMLHIFVLEACRIVQDGVASAKDVDTGARLGLGHPMGPLELFDALNGVQLFGQVCSSLEQDLGSRFKIPIWVNNYIRAGRTGRSSGKGFHDYTKE